MSQLIVNIDGASTDLSLNRILPDQWCFICAGEHLEDIPPQHSDTVNHLFGPPSVWW